MSAAPDERANGARYPDRREIWRFKLAARVVIYSIVLGAIDGDSQEAADRLFWHAMESKREQLVEWVEGLQRECEQAGKVGALSFADSIVARADRAKASERKEI